MLCDVSETDEMRVAKLLASLKDDIREKLITILNMTRQLACNLALNIEKEATKKMVHNNVGYNRTPRTLPLRNTTNTSVPNKRSNQDSVSKNNINVPLKDTVCFKCHGHGHYMDACPNPRAFTTQEWEEIKSDNDPKVLLVAKNGGEVESWPSVGSEEPDGTYRLNEATGALQRYESRLEESESEEERERIMPEDDHYKLF